MPDYRQMFKDAHCFIHVHRNTFILFGYMQVGNGSGSPYKYPELTSSYIVKWITGAKKYYNLNIDYVGVSDLLAIPF